MSDSLIAIILLLLAVSVVMVEVFIPSGGFLGLIALTLLGTSYFFAYGAWYASAPSMFWGFVMASLVAAPSSVAFGFYLLPRTRFGKRVLLEGPELSEVTPFTSERDRLLSLVGSTGRTVGLLNPGGLVEVDGQRYHCESEGQIIESGTQVQIVDVRRNSLIVLIPEPDPAGPGDAGHTDPIRSDGQPADGSAAEINAAEAGLPDRPFPEPAGGDLNVAESTDTARPLDFDLPEQ